MADNSNHTFQDLGLGGSTIYLQLQVFLQVLLRRYGNPGKNAIGTASLPAAKRLHRAA